MKRLSEILLLVILSLRGGAQDVLQLDQAIKLALQQNYTVMVGKNNVEIAKAQNNLGNAGMSPTVSLNGNYNTSLLNSYQEFNTGATQNRPGASALANGVSINADWLVFDGGRMFAIRKRLMLNEGLSKMVLKQQMENTIYDVISAYYNVTRILALKKAAEQNLTIYDERLKIASLKMEIGSESKVDFLLSRSDQSQARSAIVQLEIDLLTAKVRLNTILGRPADTDFVTPDSIPMNTDIVLDELRRTAGTNNTSLLIAKQNEQIIQQGIAEARSAVLPFIQVGASYLITNSRSQAGFVLLNRQSGFNAGVTGRWVLFNGNKNNKLIKERQINVLNQRLNTEQTKLNVDGLVLVQFKAFELSRQIMEQERQNLQDSKEVQEVSIERYRIGKGTLLETIETQKNLEDAQIRYMNAVYAMKLAETELLRVNGSLIR